MTSDDDQIAFYMRNRRQINEWSARREDAERLMRDAVTAGSEEAAINLLMGASGIANVDFYIRNRAVITEWAALRGRAALVLHDLLLEAAALAGCRVSEEKRGWTTVGFPSETFADYPPHDYRPQVLMIWTKQDLLKVSGTYPYPRVALSRDPKHWQGEDFDKVFNATLGAAGEMGMRYRAGKNDKWWLHWGVLPEISGTQDLRTYADACVTTLRQMSERLLPLVGDAMAKEAR